MMSDEVLGLVDRAFSAWRVAVNAVPEVVVQPSIPILYFGDLDSYTASPTRIVTVGLNPSREEFPSGAPFSRLAGADSESRDEYMSALNAYFVTEPYRSWFGTFEPILNGLDASYYPNWLNSALHTDLCSPVATDPTWTGLDEHHRVRLIHDGQPLWLSRVRVLKPDVMLLAVERRHFVAISFEAHGPHQEIHRIERTRPYLVESWLVDLGEYDTRIVFGQAAQRPFGTVSSADKVEMGRRIDEVLRG